MLSLFFCFHFVSFLRCTVPPFPIPNTKFMALLCFQNVYLHLITSKLQAIWLISVACGVECVVVLGCLRWAWKRCTYIGSYDSAEWPIATADEFLPVPRVCRIILAVYEPDLRRPNYIPAGGYRLNPDWVVKRVTYEQSLGHAPPYLIYRDHDNREIVMAIRGLNLAKESDYKLLLDNRLGKQMFDVGYVHHGLLKSATWVLNAESETLRRLWEENGREYKMVFAGQFMIKIVVIRCK